MVKATQKELEVIVKFASMLWPECDSNELKEEFSELLHDQDAAIFLAKEGTEFVGFAQCQLRKDYVEGTESSPVGYLEGIFVQEGFRRKGMGKQLLAACEIWAKERGCKEFASDLELDNIDSLRFHLKSGFQEVNRIICLTKKL
ncbi:aminoglycoside 6'-N-acetyltransferase [Neobacillus sp. SuZ13]|uniref:aminoglycoside 6'-N-acetyltransferase n=1 Tax=Neobacillus sp. SuZ13 TaxID=3047875 RepID=UPI0032DFB8CE